LEFLNSSSADSSSSDQLLNTSVANTDQGVLSGDEKCVAGNQQDYRQQPEQDIHDHAAEILQDSR